MRVFKFKYFLYILFFFSYLAQGQVADKFQDLYEKGLKYSSSNKDSAFYCYQKLTEDFKPLLPIQQAKVHYLKLKLYHQKQEKDTLLITLENRLKKVDETDTLQKADLLFRIGVSNISKEQNHKSIPYLLEALGLYKKLKRQEDVNRCKIHLSESYRVQDQPENGVTLLREALQDKNLSYEDRAHAYNRLAALLNSRKYNADSVVKYSKKCIQIAEKNKYYKLLALSQNELGYIYHRRRQNYQDAEQYYKAAIKNFRLVDEHRNIINTRINYSNLFIDKKQYQKALEVINKSFDDLKVEYPSRNTRRLFLQLSKIHRLLKNYKEALEYLDLANLMERMIYFNEVDAKLFEMAVKYDVKSKEQELLNQKEKNNLLLQRNRLLWVGSFLIMVVLLVIIYNFRIRRKFIIHKQLLAEKEKNELQSEIETKNRKLVAKTLQVINQNELENKIIPELKAIAKNSGQAIGEKLTHICNEIKFSHNHSLWEEFEKSFTEVNKSFYTNLTKEYPNLSSNEMKLCAFIKLNMNTKDMASLLNISVRGIETARYRLRKKLGLDQKTSLYQFLQKF
jgi:DNA-binding CsgD family transcriptional regulator